MPGKNQTKRINKHKAHALMVWEREQITAARAHSLLSDAIAEFDKHKADLPTQDVADIETKAAEQFQEIERFLIKARNNFMNNVGL